MMLSEETSAVRPQKQTRFNGAKLVWMLKGSPLTVTGAVIIVLMLLMMIFSPWLATHDPNAIDLTARLLPPSAAHWFGTDEVGRDLFSRVLVGSQQSILAGLVVVAIAGMIGSLLGCLSGVLGGRADAIIMRIMDIMLSIPSLVLTMALAAALGPSLFNAMLAIAIVRIPFYVRLARGQALVVRQYTYVQAAKTFGASRWHLISWHILRNSLPPLIVQASLDIGSAILMAATLGFIGLGAQQPSAEWGAMVANGRNYVLDQWWYCAFPGAAILLTAVGFNLFGDVHALNNVSLQINRGEIVGLVGESGSGKSVTAMLIMRLLQTGSYCVHRGQISLLGDDVLNAREKQLRQWRGARVAMIFQEPMTALNPTLRIGLQMMDVIRHHQPISRREARAKAIALLEEMQIPDAVEVMSRYPFELSGGMRQRVMIALAFSCEPQLIIADEPTTALDVTVQLQVLRLLKHKARASGTAVLFISHDMAVVSQLCDSVYVMYAGSVIESGVTADVIHHPRHPYTIGLLQCAPEHGVPRQLLPAIPGTVPNLTHLPEGCAFRDRCYAAGAQCENVPALTACGDNNQRCACWYPQQEVISV
ncbi:D,D-dipeptide ABC transporter permease [Escherichia coli]|nr:D,D-dipeptide ABC transporter permease [Escherichia coli]EFN9558437.1 D,D-dipeptide ABC transporter permease [Escherichia coli]